ncbi:MAG: class I SAM-dependent methyltransferase [Thermanaerothrix sp.]|nr:class I SAM-dependent methyltransferase [Thermanaerothrix sp.]
MADKVYPMERIFWLLYHPFAWAYDWVASVVSAGRWQKWVRTILPFVRGVRVLEIGFGPGHLQVDLRMAGFSTFGVDESMPMIKITRRRLQRAGVVPINLVRSQAEALPFACECFDCVVATFPGMYILATSTLVGIWRVLRPGGCLIVLLGSTIGGDSLYVRFLRWFFRVTSQGPWPHSLSHSIAGRLLNLNYVNVTWKNSDYNGDQLLVLMAQKPLDLETAERHGFDQIDR